MRWFIWNSTCFWFTSFLYLLNPSITETEKVREERTFGFVAE
jgi:hypothetical protein